MANISSELNSILNENKDPIEEKKSPLIFILLLIITVVAVYFAVMYFSIKDTKIIKDDSDKYEKIIEENISLTSQNQKAQEELEKLKKQMVEMLEERIISEKENQKSEVKEEVQKEPEVIKEITNIVTTTVDKNNFKKIYFSDKANIFKCYDFTEIGIVPPNSCLNDIKPFLEKNSNALRYQIIPVLNDEDEKVFSKFDKDTKSRLLNGVSSQRVTEVIWQIKKILGNDTIITADSYFVKSEKGNSGFILKAYY